MSHKGSWDRSDPRKVAEAEYWKPENVERRKRLAEEQKQRYEKFKAEYDYPNTASKSDEAITIKQIDRYLSQDKFDQLKQGVIKLNKPTK